MAGVLRVSLVSRQAIRQRTLTNQVVNQYAQYWTGIVAPSAGTSFCQAVNQNITQTRNKRTLTYSNFPQKEKPHPYRKGRLFTIIAALVSLGVYFGFIDTTVRPDYNFKVDAASPEKEVTSSSEGEVEAAEGENGEKKKKKKRVGFRDSRIIEYENRIREYSTPDKIFRYFATLRVSGDNPGIFMTPDDFVRSITPSLKQPEGLGLDEFKKFDPKKENLECGLREDSIFYKLGQNGLISFSDYMFLLVVLSTPPRMFEIAFKMFDLNGDGDVEFMEFEKVREIAQGRTAVGRRHRDHSTTGSIINPKASALNHYFFGENLDQRLTVERFLQFQKQLQLDVLWLEFNRYADDDDVISERDFAANLLDYAQLPDARKIKMLKRVRKAFKADDPEAMFEPKGITYTEFLDFHKVLKHITDIDTALMFYTLAGASIDKATMKHVAKTVAKVDLSDHVVDVVIVLFDENGDNELSNKEFVAVMKRRLMRGLDRPKDTGFSRMVSSLWKCAKTHSWTQTMES